MTDLEAYEKHLGPDWAEGLHALPDYMIGGIVRYVLHGIPAGSFMDAVISNDLFTAVGKADIVNREYLHAYCNFFYNHAPSTCFGSKDKRDAWIKQGGIIGMSAALETKHDKS